MWILLGSFLGLMVLGVPVALSMAGASLVYILATGTVPDVRPYLWSARVSIVPLHIGGGTRLKIYEAMAAQVPVVSTTVGAEGLSVDPGRDLAIADSAEGFASAVFRRL